MKQYLSFIIPFILLPGYSIRAELPLDYTKGLTGIYSMTYMNWDGEAVIMPEPGFSGHIKMKIIDSIHLEMIFSVKVREPKETFNQESTSERIELKPESRKVFALYNGSKKIGMIPTTAIEIKTTTENSVGIVDIKATRQGCQTKNPGCRKMA